MATSSINRIHDRFIDVDSYISVRTAASTSDVTRYQTPDDRYVIVHAFIHEKQTFAVSINEVIVLQHWATCTMDVNAQFPLMAGQTLKINNTDSDVTNSEVAKLYKMI